MYQITPSFIFKTGRRKHKELCSEIQCRALLHANLIQFSSNSLFFLHSGTDCCYFHLTTTELQLNTEVGYVMKRKYTEFREMQSIYKYLGWPQ